jgi:hypothetical protein
MNIYKYLGIPWAFALRSAKEMHSLDFTSFENSVFANQIDFSLKNRSIDSQKPQNVFEIEKACISLTISR